MKGWLIANPNNRKTPTGMLRFINGWLAREQNKAKNSCNQKGGEGSGRSGGIQLPEYPAKETSECFSLWGLWFR